MFRSKDLVSDNAADTNWGGVAHTERAIRRGKYDDRRRFEKAPQTLQSLQKRSMKTRDLYNKKQDKMHKELIKYLKNKGYNVDFNYISTNKSKSKPMSGFYEKGTPSKYSGDDGIYNTRPEFGIQE